ncbi:hypothetical protein [Aureimonas sp. SK2]|uniref:hypothetical protein n=1 Tax=Aureimonas sp. SK2 TaxID=3015992 RepID=UPI002443B8BA|nr:hypothetical protein [Aureimonas sp. SK2]
MRMPRPQSARARAAAIAAASAMAQLLAAGEASAGAWTLERGSGLAIVTAGGSQASGAFDGDRRSRATSRFRKAEIQVLAEYGVTDRFTLRGRTEWRQLRFEAREPDSGLGVSEIGGRFRLMQRGGFVASAEANLRIAEADPALDPAGAGLLEGGAEGRLLAGYGFSVNGMAAFVDGQGAYRVAGPTKADEIHADLTFGLRPRADLLLLAQSFSVVGLEADGIEGYDAHKLQLSAVYDVTPTVAVQAGGWGTVAGRNALDERGLLAALWLKF